MNRRITNILQGFAIIALALGQDALSDSPMANTNVTAQAVTLSTYQVDYYEIATEDDHSESTYYDALEACDNSYLYTYYGTGLSPYWAYTYIWSGASGYHAQKEWSYQWVDVDLSGFTNATAHKAWLQWTIEEVFWGVTQLYTNIYVKSHALPLNTTSTVYEAFETRWPTWEEYDESTDITSYISDVSVWVAAQSVDIQPEPVRPQPTIACTRDPINTISGNVSYDTTDIAIPTPGVPLVFSRSYNSVAERTGPLGPRWSHSYYWALSQTNSVFDGQTNTWILVCAGDGAEHKFKVGGSSYEAPFDTNWKLDDEADGYILTIPPATEYFFSSNGVLTKISDSWGNSVVLTYSNGTELCLAEHSNGLALEFGYTSGNLTSIAGPDTNLTMSFSYSPDGELTNATRTVSSDDQVTVYTYDAGTNHLLTLRINPNGDEFAYSYESGGSGRGTSMALNTNLYAHTVAYSNNWNQTHVTYARGDTNQTFVYHINPIIQRVDSIDSPGKNLEISYDDDGNVITQKVTDVESGDYLTKVTSYDDRHNPTNTSFGYSTAATNTVVMQWHPDYHLPTSIVDAEGHRVSLTYTNGQPSTVTVHDDSTSYETKMAYLTNGLLVAVTNANNHWVRYQYDGYGNPTSVVPQEGPAIRMTYSNLGYLERIETPPYDLVYQEPSGSPSQTPSVDDWSWQYRVTEFDCDLLGRPLKITYPNSQYETFLYDSLGNLTNHVGIGGRTTSYSWLPGRKLQSAVRSLGSSNVTVTSFQYDRQFNSLVITDALGREVESYVLDTQDRPTTITNVEEQTMSVTYGVGSMVTNLTRFDGSTVGHSYNSQGLLATETFSDATNAYGYLKNGLLETAENGLGVVPNSFNGANRMTASVGVAPSSTVTYAYYPAGQLSNVTSVAGETAFSLDNADRVATIVAPGDTCTYGYNTNNGLVATLAFSNSGVNAEFAYDNLDRIEEIVWKNSSSQTIYDLTYSYGSSGDILAVQKANGEETYYNYDDFDRLTNEMQKDSLGNTNLDVSVGYDLVGNRTTMTRDGISLDYTRGDGNRITEWAITTTNLQLTVDVTGHANETIGTGERYGELWVSNTVAIVPESDGTNFWAYGLPVGVGTQSVVAAICDEAGNMAYTTNSMFLSIVTNGTYGYNDAGCVTSIVYSGEDYTYSRGLSWNQQYQLVSASTNSTTTETYAYDALGRRAYTVVDGATNWYVHDGVQVAAEVDSSGGLLKSYTWGPGIDNLLFFTVYGSSSTNTYYCLTDHLGSVHALTDESGDIVESYRYDAWGRVIGVYNADGEAIERSAVGNHYLWQGRWYSWETGLYFFRARWYEPVMGRWLSNDPIGISGGLNQYVFVSDNPVNFVDPFGLRLGLVSFGGLNGAGRAGVVGIIASGAAGFLQFSVDVQGLFLERTAIAAELQSNRSSIRMLQDVIASQGRQDWGDGFVRGGTFGADIRPQGGACEERQDVRNLFESFRNTRGWGSALREGVTRLGTTGYNMEALPQNMLPVRRLELAGALLARQQAYNRFLVMQWNLH